MSQKGHRGPPLARHLIGLHNVSVIPFAMNPLSAPPRRSLCRGAG
jgi:hypothetical protein